MSKINVSAVICTAILPDIHAGKNYFALPCAFQLLNPVYNSPGIKGNGMSPGNMNSTI